MMYAWRTAMGIWACLWMAQGTWAAQTQESATPVARFQVQGAQVLDVKNHLVWKRCSEGQEYKDGVGCSGYVKAMTYKAAEAHAKKEGWRLPTTEELRTLIDQQRLDDKKKPLFDPVVFPDSDLEKMRYWGKDCSSVNFVTAQTHKYIIYRCVQSDALRLVKDADTKN